MQISVLTVCKYSSILGYTRVSRLFEKIDFLENSRTLEYLWKYSSILEILKCISENYRTLEYHEEHSSKMMKFEETLEYPDEHSSNLSNLKNTRVS